MAGITRSGRKGKSRDKSRNKSRGRKSVMMRERDSCCGVAGRGYGVVLALLLAAGSVNAAVPGWDSDRTMFYSNGAGTTGQTPTWTDRTGKAKIYYYCWEVRSGPTYSELSCHQPIDNGHNLRARGNLSCSAISNSESKDVDFTGTTTVGAWTIQVHDNNGISPTGNTMKELYGTASGVQHTYITPGFSATYTNTSGVAIKELKITCQLNDYGSWTDFQGGFGPVTLTFKPPAVATFTVSRQTASSVKHRVKDEGIHIYKLDFSGTVWYTSRKITHTFDKSTCELDSAWTTLHYDSDVPTVLIPGSNYDLFHPGTTLDLKTAKTPDPKFAYYRLRAKRSSAGTYDCSATVTQTVD